MTLSRHEDQHTCNTRNKGKIRLQNVKKQWGKQRIAYQAVNDFLIHETETFRNQQILLFLNVKSQGGNLPSSNINPMIYVRHSSQVFNFRNITFTEVKDEISKINDGKSAGLNKISNKLLKVTGETIVSSLTYIFNLSINTGLILAKVSPIYKSGDKTECGNYRPISVIPALAKVFEKLVYRQLNEFLDANQLLSNQSGLRTHHSTETAFLHSSNQYLVNMDRGFINGVLLLDVKKAFDTVDHKILIDKLEADGVQGHALQWFTSYLSGRKQVCKINNEISNILPISLAESCKGQILGLYSSSYILTTYQTA